MGKEQKNLPPEEFIITRYETKSLSKGRVMIIDNDPYLLESLCEFFQSSDYSVTSVSVNSIKSRVRGNFLTIIRRLVQKLLRENPQVVIVDIDLGFFINGIDVIQEIRQRNPEVHTIVFTSAMRTEINNVGHEYARKPISLIKIKEMVEKGIRGEF